jgi:hypothetical protein
VFSIYAFICPLRYSCVPSKNRKDVFSTCLDESYGPKSHWLLRKQSYLVVDGSYGLKKQFAPGGSSKWRFYSERKEAKLLIFLTLPVKAVICMYIPCAYKSTSTSTCTRVITMHVFITSRYPEFFFHWGPEAYQDAKVSLAQELAHAPN